MSDVLRADFIRAASDLSRWVSSYDPSGRTFRQFWADYAVAAGEFEALSRAPGLPAALIEAAHTVYDMPLHRGFEPSAYSPARCLDELIHGGTGES